MWRLLRWEISVAGVVNYSFDELFDCLYNISYTFDMK